MVTPHCPSWIGTTTRHRQDYPTPDLQSCCPLHVGPGKSHQPLAPVSQGTESGRKEAAILSLLHSKSPSSQEGSAQVYQESSQGAASSCTPDAAVGDMRGWGQDLLVARRGLGT